MNNVLLSLEARSAFLFAKDSPASLQCPSSSLSPEIAPPRRRPSPSLRFVRSAARGSSPRCISSAPPRRRPSPRCVSSAPPRKGRAPRRASSGSPVLAAHGRFLRSLLQQNRVFGSLFLVSARFEDARRRACRRNARSRVSLYGRRRARSAKPAILLRMSCPIMHGRSRLHAREAAASRMFHVKHSLVSREFKPEGRTEQRKAPGTSWFRARCVSGGGGRI